MRVPPGFHDILQGLRRPCKVSQGLNRAPQRFHMIPHRFHKGSTRFHKRSTNVLQGFVREVLCRAHLLTQRGPKCWLCGKSDHVAAGLTVRQSKCSALLSNTYLVGFGPTRLQGHGVRV